MKSVAHFPSNRRFLVALIALVAFFPIACGKKAGGPAPVSEGPVILIINEEQIKKNAWENFVSLRLGELKLSSLPPKAQSQMLDEFIQRCILLQEAKKRGIVVEAKEVPPETPSPGTTGTGQPAVGQPSISNKAKLEERWADLVIQRFNKSVAEAAPQPSRDDVQRYYEEHKKEFDRNGFYVREIRVESQTIIDEISRQLASNKVSFAELAKKYSRGPNAGQGGLSYYERGQMPSEIEEKVLVLRPGETSKPIKTGYGFHIFKLERFAQPLTYDQAREEIMDEIVQTRQQVLVAEEAKKLYTAAQVELFPDALGFGYEGAFKRN